MGSCGSADIISPEQSVNFLSQGVQAASQTFKQLCDTLEAAVGTGGLTVSFELNACQLILAGLLLVLAGVSLLNRLRKQGKVYVLDFAVHKPHDR
jgi:hypothetical protein